MIEKRPSTPSTERPKVLVGTLHYGTPGTTNEERESVHMPLEEVRIPTNEEVASLIDKLRESSSPYMYRGDDRRFMSDSEYASLSVQERKVNEQRQEKVNIYKDILRLLGQGPIVDAVTGGGEKLEDIAESRSTNERKRTKTHFYIPD